MKLKVRSNGQSASPALYTVAGAAYALALSKGTLLNLEKRGIVSPRRAIDSPTRSQRIYDDSHLHQILAHYERRGGIRLIPKPQR